jgi:hypothetical protein
MGRWSKKEMADFIAAEQAEVAEDLPRHGLPEDRNKFITDAHNLTLADIAAEEGHIDLAAELRRQIGD